MGKNRRGGQKGFVISHVKAIYYSWKDKKLLKDKLDEMDKTIEGKIDKTAISNQQADSADKVPSSALVKSMNDALSKKADAVSVPNGTSWNYGPTYASLKVDTKLASGSDTFIPALAISCGTGGGYWTIGTYVKNGALSFCYTDGDDPSKHNVISIRKPTSPNTNRDL